jgi:hypothetical protein
MPRVECVHEADVLTAVKTRRWPNRVDDELRDHVMTCDVCADLIAVVSAFEGQHEADAAIARTRVPDSAIVWWKSQMRARQEAAKIAVRPITVTQAVAFATALGFAGAVFGATAPWFQRSVRWFGSSVAETFSFQKPELPVWAATLITDHTLLAAGAIMAFLLLPLGVYWLIKFSERPA